jgi:hypothetical protein
VAPSVDFRSGHEPGIEEAISPCRSTATHAILLPPEKAEEVSRQERGESFEALIPHLNRRKLKSRRLFGVAIVGNLQFRRFI